ncbi:hypothetical protein CHLNCDRAFT_134248 [Chlorella variabilis]|uniref:DNA endonuclease activator Ctp1 C-terminal domain-containing protein n=1 Tax=Chlorella variabilis TaxID=554065 RepID=E1ZFL2_CHLVA|nr:hypothetical protein CHLNCDRAFT_134248 [Chlorella variabilis]EFN55297.1 hypothetical protein CHLNCDRAFT_134248 [Chlorella variabilis]|eukprot:XP_005847399.1 hypothetical protein CHLNCDRAFT_134248 [Chlorella variabilis]
MKSVPDPADLPALLAHSGQYLADLQRQLNESSDKRAALEREKNSLHTQVVLVTREKSAATANLKAEIARLKGRLDEACAAGTAQAERLRAAEQRAVELREAAEAAVANSRREVDGLQAQVQELEAICAQLRQQVEQQAAELERQQQAQAAAEERHQQAVAPLEAERDEAKDASASCPPKYFKYKRSAQELAQAYRDLKDKARRDRREQAEEVRRLKAQLAAAQALPPGPGGAAAAPPQPARPLSAASSGAEEDSASYQLHLSISETVPQRLPSVSTGEVVVQLSAAITPGAARRTAAEQAQTSPLRPSLQRHHPNGSARSAAAAGRGGAWARSPLQRRLEPPPEPEAPAAEEVWPVEEPPQAVPPTDVAELPGSDQDEDVDVTQAVPPPAAQVICTQLPPPAQQQGLWQPRQQDQAAAKHARSILAKRQIDVEPITAAAGSMGPPPSLQSKRRAVSPSEAQHEALLPPQHELSSPPQQHRREQQLEHDHEWSPLASTPDEAAAAELAAAAVPVQAVDWGGQGQRVQQAVAWPDARPSGQQQPQQLRGGGWKQAVRDHAPAHAAFDLRAPAGGSGVGGMAGHQRAVPPLREANGPPAGSRAGGSGNGGGGNSGTGYRYQAVVRKKAEREKLQGVECQQCKRFYAALESWGTIGQEQLQQEGSRHRYIWRPPDTQEGFWDMDVTQRPPAKGRQDEHAAQQPEQQQAGHQVFWQAGDDEHAQQQPRQPQHWG